MKRLTYFIFFMWMCVVALPSELHYFHDFHSTRYEIRDLCADKKGMIWFATTIGLRNYSDLQVHQIDYHFLDDRLRVPMSEIQCDGAGNLWCRTNVNTYLIYNPRTNQLTENVHELLRQLGMAISDDYMIKIDEQGKIWIQSKQDIYCYTPSSQKKKKLTIPNLPNDIPNHPFCVKEDRLYIYGCDSIYLVDTQNVQVLKSFATPNYSFRNKPIIYEASNNSLWLGEGNCFYFKDNTSGKWKRREVLNTIKDIKQLNESIVGVSTLSGGISIYNLNGDIIEEHTAWNMSLKSLRIANISTDTYGRFYVSYNKGGLSIFQPDYSGNYIRHINDVKLRQENDDILCFTSNREGNIWIGVNDFGIYSISQPNSVEHPIYVNGEKHITTLLTDQKERIWIGAFCSGLYCYDHGKIKKYLQGLSPFSLLETEDGKILAGIHDEGIYKLNPEDGKSCCFSVPGGQWVAEMAMGRDNKLYAASTGGLQIVDPNTMMGKMLQGNEAGTQKFSRWVLQSVLCDRRNLVWLICDCGMGVVNIYNPQQDRIYTLPQLEDYNIISMLEDKAGNIWLTTDSGLIQVKIEIDLNGDYDFHTSGFIYSTELQYNPRVTHLLDDGRMLFGTTNGYQLIDPQKMEEQFYDFKETSVPIFNSLEINYNKIQASQMYNGRVLLDEDISCSDKLELKYNENNIRLGVFMKDYGCPYRKQLVYRLRPQSDEFHKVGDNQIALYNLEPGYYQLEVKEEDFFNNRHTCSVLNITILPPWWKTQQAYMGYCLFIVSMLFLIAHYVYSQQKNKERLTQIKLEAEKQCQLNEMKLRFFTNISHDFRTPLSLIIMPLSDLIQQTRDVTLQQYLKPIYCNAKRLLELVNQLLDFRKLESCNMSLNLSYENIVSFIREICMSFSIMADEMQIHFDFQSSVEKLDMAFDEDKMSKILMNILSNAFKYTPKGGHISIKLEVWNTKLVLKIADTGTGIPDDEKNCIFDRFYQASNCNYVQMGCGIGLHIVREYIKLHNGEITVSDNLPQGSIFTISIPIQKEEKRLASQIENKECSIENSDNQKIHTLLLVEDNVDFLLYLTHSLSQEYCILQAHNGREALSMLETNIDVDVIISDIMMDEMDGLTLCAKIKNNIELSHVPVILLTAKTLEEDVLKGLEMGADDYITKPFNMSILKQRLRNLIERNSIRKKQFQQKIDIAPSEITITSIDEQFMKNAIEVVEKHIEDPDFSVEVLSKELGMHRSSLYKKIHYITGKTPLEFIRLIRLKRAKQLIEQSGMYVSEVAYQIGFNSPRIFAKYFKEEFGVLPSECMKRKNLNGKHEYSED